jgi:hypothetical protein
MLCSAPALADDVPGDALQTLFANEHVEVYRATLEPGEKMPVHSGHARLVYSLSDYTIAWTERGETTTKTWRAGDVHRHEALDHAVENTGNTIADYLVVARTDRALPGVEHGAAAAEVTGGYAALIAEYDDARVLRVALPAGGRQPIHEGTARVVYSLNDYSVVFSTPDGEELEREFATGDVHWHDAGPHAVANAGDETARFVIFALH